jgi:hypothetical protein
VRLAGPVIALVILVFALLSASAGAAGAPVELQQDVVGK